MPRTNPDTQITVYTVMRLYDTPFIVGVSFSLESAKKIVQEDADYNGVEYFHRLWKYDDECDQWIYEDESTDNTYIVQIFQAQRGES